MSLVLNFWKRIRRRTSGTGGGTTPPPSSEYDTDAAAFFLVNTGLNTLQKTAINVLILALKSAGIWSRMIAIYPFVGGTADAHKWNLKDPRDNDSAFRLSFFGGWTHAATGAKPNGTNGYAKTFIDVHENCPQYSFHGSYYSRENLVPSGDHALFGGAPSGPGIILEFYSTDRLYGYGGHTNTAGSPSGLALTGLSSFQGLFTLSFLYNNFFKAYRNASQIGSVTTDRYGYFPNNDPNSSAGKLYLGANNNNETANLFSSYECGYCSFGWGLNDSQITAYNTIITNYLTSLTRL